MCVLQEIVDAFLPQISEKDLEEEGLFMIQEVLDNIRIVNVFLIP